MEFIYILLGTIIGLMVFGFFAQEGEEVSWTVGAVMSVVVLGALAGVYFLFF